MGEYVCPGCGTELNSFNIDVGKLGVIRKLYCPKCNFEIFKRYYERIMDLGKTGVFVIENDKTRDNKKPPLGCRPSYVAISARICELCEAIKRYSTEPDKHKQIQLWTEEIYMLNEVDRKLRREEKEKTWVEKDDGTFEEVK